MNIDELLESVDDGLYKIGCTREKRELILRVLTNSRVYSEIKKSLSLENDKSLLEETEILDETYIPLEQSEIKNTQRIKSDPRLNLGDDDKPLSFDISYPKSIRKDGSK